MQRLVEPEWLDELAPSQPAAAGSRRDLRRLNAWMGHAYLLRRALQRAGVVNGSPCRLLELGAGEGHLLARVAQGLGPAWRGTQALLLDQANVVSPAVAQAFHRAGWQVRTMTQEVFRWLDAPAEHCFDVILANLFLHHFSDSQLRHLLEGAAGRSRVFVALEPRRSRWALAGSRLVGVLGCNRVTRHDAPISVRAGFAGQELSALWPRADGWRLEEGAAGWFSHLFVACSAGEAKR